MPLVEDLPSRFAAYLGEWLRPATVATLAGGVSEHHHSHILASRLVPLEAVLERYYDRRWRRDTGGRIAKARADIWCPPVEQTATPQLFVEIKLAFLRDDKSDFLGIPTYGLARAAPSWADDIYRLLVGRAAAAHSAFVLSVIGEGTHQFIRDERAAKEPLGQRKDVDADAVWTSIASLPSRADERRGDPPLRGSCSTAHGSPRHSACSPQRGRAQQVVRAAALRVASGRGCSFGVCRTGWRLTKQMPTVPELAYALWEARGRPVGDDWADWFAAEAQMRARTLETARTPMGRVIRMFMWPYQESFRINLEIRAKALLQEIAPTLEPEVLLVGVRVPQAKDGLPVCVEPEDGEWEVTLFSNCFRRSDEIYETHEGHNVLYGDDARTRDQPENIRKSSIKRAVGEVFQTYDRAHGTITFCSWPERLGNYHVVCALQLNKAQLDEYPKIETPITFGDYNFSGGFVDLVIEELLDEAKKTLWSPDPGRFHDVLDADGYAMLRKAGDRLCSVLTLATRDVMFQRAFDKFNKISALLYEGAEGVGRLIVAPADHQAVHIEIEFSGAVPLEESRWARKILEMAHGALCCVCAGATGIRGLGSLTDADAEGLFVVEFTGHFSWQLSYRGTVLLQASFAVPRLPRALIKEATFKSTFRRLFEGRPQDEEQAWKIVQAAIEQRHGTMIVFSEAAEQESKRLRSQSTPITPVALSAALVEQVSGIDGAILVDPRGTCWALGVILDGVATKEGNPARGARFNSATRYHAAQGQSRTLILVISEDRSVDMLPTLRPQIAPSSIERRMARLRQCTFNNFHTTRNWLKEHAFYLTPDQCRIVNDEIARIESEPRDPRLLHIATRKFEPHPDMDDSYYLPESTPERRTTGPTGL